MLAARGLREDDDLSIHRVAREFLVVVRRQAVRVVVASALGAIALTALAALALYVAR